MGERPASAMVLGAGLGLRMRPHTLTIPKPLVNLGGRPMIDHVLDRLADARIATAVVNVHYRAEALITHLAQRQQPNILISDERDLLLDTGGGVARALPLLGPGAFLIHNSDSVWSEQGKPNLERLIEAWDGERMDSLLLLAPCATSLGYAGNGDFALLADGTIRRRGRAEATPFVFTGVSIAHPRLFEGAAVEPFSLNRLWDKSIARGRVFGKPFEGTWMHVGDPASLLQAEAAMSGRANVGR